MNCIHFIKRASLACVLAFSMLLFLSACSQEQGPNYADDEAIAAIAQGLENRWKFLNDNQMELSDEDEKIQVTEIEIENLAPYKNREYENSKLQEYVLQYLNLLLDMKTTAETFTVDDKSFEKWSKQQDERKQLIVTFVNDYNLKVKPEFDSDLQKIIKEGNFAAAKSAISSAVEDLTKTITFEKTDDGYGFYTYTCIAENTTPYTFKRFSLNIAFYDAEGVKADESYAGTDLWKPGEKVKFETMSDIDASEVRITSTSYDVEE